MSRRPIICILVIILLLVGCAQQALEMPTPTITETPSPATTFTQSSEPPAKGDWIVTNQQIVENVTITLDGNLVVKNSGSLTFKGVILQVNCSYNGQHKIEVEPGSSMFIYDSKIETTNPEYRFAFYAKGDALEMKRSELHGCGWGRMGADIGSGIPQTATLSYDVAGLYVQTDGAIIEDTLISDNFAAMVLHGNRITVVGNEIKSNDFVPISIFGSDNFVGNNTIYHSVLSGYGCCIDIFTGHDNKIMNNTIARQIRESDVGVLAGITIYDSYSNCIQNNILKDLNGGGIFVGATGISVSTNNIIADNIISADEIGVCVHGRNNVIEGNSIEGAQTGIDIAYSYDNVVANNILTEIGIWHGIRICHSSYNSVINNQIFVERSSGIYMWMSSKDNRIEGNTISSAEPGIFLFDESDCNEISGNVVDSASSSTVIDDSSGNMIHRNSFRGNSANHSTGNNQWNYGSKGNYWSDYAGQDLNGDGIGDQPYTIGPKDVDNYPLMDPVPALFASASTADLAEYEEPLPGINISQEETWEDREMTLVTQLHIQNGGNLTLKNVKLTLGSELHAAYIWVHSGGSLQILNSTITDDENGYGGRFLAEKGAFFFMSNSEWHGMYCVWPNEGFEVFGANTIITDSRISGVSLIFHAVSRAYIGNNYLLRSLCPVVLSGSNCIIENNTIDNSLWQAVGIVSENEDGEFGNNLIYNNRISNTWGRGLLVHMAGNNIIKGNEFSNIYFDPVHRSDAIDLISDNNLVYHNNFLQNGNNVSDEGSFNSWDNGSEGNYWSDYTGKDDNGDGIGDTPYTIPTSGVDNYPLMNPYERT